MFHAKAHFLSLIAKVCKSAWINKITLWGAQGWLKRERRKEKKHQVDFLKGNNKTIYANKKSTIFPVEKKKALLNLSTTIHRT